MISFAFALMPPRMQIPFHTSIFNRRLLDLFPLRSNLPPNSSVKTRSFLWIETLLHLAIKSGTVEIQLGPKALKGRKMSLLG
jgi:hypothetical protein